MSHSTPGRGDPRERECRSTRACMCQCAVAHVALHDGVRRHDRRGMSLGVSRLSDMVDDPCRLGRAGGPTGSTTHVALHTCLERHGRQAMSPFTSGLSDMEDLGCRPSRRPRATCSPWYVALHTCEVRHAAVTRATSTRAKVALDRNPWKLLRLEADGRRHEEQDEERGASRSPRERGRDRAAAHPWVSDRGGCSWVEGPPSEPPSQ